MRDSDTKVGLQATILLLFIALAEPGILNAAPVIAVGQPSPHFEATAMSGRRIDPTLSRAAKPLYLKFWATWCVACIAEMPHFVDAHKRFGAGIEFIAINVAFNDTPERIERARSEFELEMPIVFDQSGELWSKFDIFGTPTHIVIDAAGKIIYISYAADEALDKALEKAYAGASS